MKARDLAALAALGLGGAYLYNRNKGDAGQTAGNEGRNAPLPGQNAGNEGRNAAMPGQDYSNEGRNAAMPGQDYSNEGRNAAMPGQDYGNEAMRTRRAYTGGSSVVASQAAPITETKAAPVVAKAAPVVKAAAPVAKTPVAEAPVVAKEPVVTAAPVAEKQLPDAKRVTQYNPEIMYNNTVKFDPKRQDSQNKFAPSAENARAMTIMERTGKSIPDTMNSLAIERKKREGTVSAQSPNDQAKAHIARQKQSASEAKTIDRVKEITKARAEKQDREDRERKATTTKKRGGTVTRMASGGAVKSSASSRGDGIAQRGKTRGRIY